MHFDEKMAPDVQEVLDTSALLEITEFEVFRIAYQSWYGRPEKDAVLEPFFTDYMFNEVVPFWVRHFTHHILKLDHERRLDPREFGIEPRAYNSSMAAKGLRYLLIAVLWLATLVVLAHFAARLWRQGECYFPPCY